MYILLTTAFTDIHMTNIPHINIELLVSYIVYSVQFVHGALRTSHDYSINNLQEDFLSRLYTPTNNNIMPCDLHVIKNFYILQCCLLSPSPRGVPHKTCFSTSFSYLGPPRKHEFFGIFPAGSRSKT